MASYLEFVNKLIALGALLPKLWPLILQIIEIFQQAKILNGEHPKLMGAEPTDLERLSSQEMSAEARVLEIYGEAKLMGAIGDGSIIRLLRDAFAFIQQNPALRQIIQLFIASLLKKPA